ncbi:MULTISPECIES: gas vesicle accessory protein GvpU [unclassified Rhizobium]|uniref:gas vesicle accessory protein GvpU n=1 Tax=unclassified Rhizobium TaxID=2613769 RepID=UPI000BD853DC|nr:MULTISPECIES: gas vesicle accessory protein GvpU [unclassified Rhizobium]MDH7805507.1 hypothetical protein [Rhizobium sp. AN67]MDQ4407018.1 gas vesicle accessory protein GvpU [Rhizobium sp. AN63]SOD60282.1 hypothetical protein SAMN05216595_5171 [Rhizobium sp. AN6A]
MTDSVNENENVNSETGDDSSGDESSDNNFLDQAAGHDWMLAWVIAHAEAYGLEVGVTLSVSGSLISGSVISGRKYIEELSSSFRTAKGPSAELAETLAKNFGQWSAVYPESGSEIDILSVKPTYIHLRNARVYQSSGAPIPNNGMLWRGKVKAVDGFTVGDLQIS